VATSSGSFRSHLVTSLLLSTTHRPAICPVYGEDLHRLFFTSILSSTFCCALRISQARYFCISIRCLPQLENVLHCAAFSSLPSVSIFQLHKLFVETREDMRSGFYLWQLSIASDWNFFPFWDLPPSALPYVWHKLSPSLVHIHLSKHVLLCAAHIASTCHVYPQSVSSTAW
jgi:hypothetical protein